MIKLNTLLFLSILIMFASCNGQSPSQITDGTLNNQNPTIAIGDTVPEIDKSTWIVFQDKNNHYWFGSDGQGVYRYDGKTILHFSTKDGLLNNRIRGIQEDKLGNVFITSLDGINKFDGQIFTTLPVIESNEWVLHPDDLWFSILGKRGEYGPYRYDGKFLYHLKFPKHYLEDEYYKDFPNMPWSPYEVYTIYKDSKGNIWFGTSNFGICRYDGKSLSWMYEKHLTEVEDGGSFGIRSIIEDKERKFWFCNTRYRYDIYPNDPAGRGSGLIDYDKENGIGNSKDHSGDSFTYFMSIIEDNDGELWMATGSAGVWRYDGENVIRYPVKDGDKNVNLFSIYKDNQGVLWLGTLQAGAYKFNGRTFEKFTP